MPNGLASSLPFIFSSWMTPIAYVPGGMSSKVQRACVLRTFITMTFVAERRNSTGKPSGDSKSAHATVPVLFLMLRIVM